jgi:hypothetical protein
MQEKGGCEKDGTDERCFERMQEERGCENCGARGEEDARGRRMRGWWDKRREAVSRMQEEDRAIEEWL